MASTTTEPRRGEVWLVALGAGRRGEPAKNRPAIVVSADEIQPRASRDLYVVVPLSSSLARSPLRPQVTPAEGVDRNSVAHPRAIRGLARGRLLRKLGRAKPDTMRELERSLAAVLGLQ